MINFDDFLDRPFKSIVLDTDTLNSETKLTNDQQIALDKMNAFRLSSGRIFCLSGYAGTGKSFLIKRLISSPSFPKHNCAVSAPTHKAKKVISDFTGMKAVTLQSLLGIGINVGLEKFDPNSKKFKQVNRVSLLDYAYVIIDECSMINKELYDLIKKTVEDSATKIIFMGDKAQLPPVNEKISKIFIDPDIETAELTEIVRQKDSNPLIPILSNIRTNLDNRNPYELITDINSDNEGIEFQYNFDDFCTKLAEYIQEKPNNIQYAKALAWTNKRVGEINDTIRKKIFGSSYRKEILPNDILMSYTTIGGYGKDIVIENSCEYYVGDVGFNTTTIDTVLGRRLDEIVTIDTNVLFMNNVETLEDNEGFNPNRVITIKVVHPSSVENYLKVYKKYIEIINNTFDFKLKKRMWIECFKFMEDHLLMQSVIENGRPVKDKDIDFGYALTVHKSQGSTYNYVFVEGDDLNKNQDLKERNQLRYVALSRPKVRAIVYHSEYVGKVGKTKLKSSKEIKFKPTYSFGNTQSAFDLDSDSEVSQTQSEGGSGSVLDPLVVDVTLRNSVSIPPTEAGVSPLQRKLDALNETDDITDLEYLELKVKLKNKIESILNKPKVIKQNDDPF